MRTIRTSLLATSLMLIFSAGPTLSAIIPATEQDRSPDALQARLTIAENSYKAGNVDGAIDQATSLVDVTDNSAFQSDQVARTAKADLSLFQLKAGHPDQTAKWIRDLLLNLQLELPMDPRYSKDTAQVIAESPKMLKDYFASVIERFGEKGDTKAIIDSIIDNTVPKNYLAQLKTYCQRMQATEDDLRELQSVANSEELKYGDELSSLDEQGTENKPDPKLSAARLDKLAEALDALATQAQQMPVGDLRPALELYKLALVANSAGHYQQAETFAQQSIAHIKAITNTVPVVPQIRVALAYALLKQGKSQEFKALRDDLLKDVADNKRLLETLARFTKASGDDVGANAIYKLGR